MKNDTEGKISKKINELNDLLWSAIDSTVEKQIDRNALAGFAGLKGARSMSLLACDPIVMETLGRALEGEICGLIETYAGSSVYRARIRCDRGLVSPQEVLPAINKLNTAAKALARQSGGFSFSILATDVAINGRGIEADEQILLTLYVFFITPSVFDTSSERSSIEKKKAWEWSYADGVRIEAIPKDKLLTAIMAAAVPKTAVVSLSDPADRSKGRGASRSLTPRELMLILEIRSHLAVKHILIEGCGSAGLIRSVLNKVKKSQAQRPTMQAISANFPVAGFWKRMHDLWGDDIAPVSGGDGEVPAPSRDKKRSRKGPPRRKRQPRPPAMERIHKRSLAKQRRNRLED